MRLRRNAVPCVMECGDTTYLPSAVCSNCKRIYDYGKKQAAQVKTVTESGERVLVKVPMYLRLGAWACPPDKRLKGDSDAETRLIAILYSLLDMQVPHKDWLGQVDGQARNIGHLRGETEWGDPVYAITAERAELLAEAIDLIRGLADFAHREGERKGSHFLHQLATGKLTIEETNKIP